MEAPLIEDDDADPKPPKIVDAPRSIFLNYGDIERDATHAECCRDGEVTWCDDDVFASDVRYVRADLFAEAVELLRRATESLGSFVSDHGWAQSDMDTMDDVDGFLAAKGKL